MWGIEGLYFFPIFWVLTRVANYAKTRLFAETLLPSIPDAAQEADGDNITATADGIENDETAAPVTPPPVTKRAMRTRESVWTRLSDYLTSLDDPKTDRDKSVASLYKHLVSDKNREKTSLNGTVDDELIVAVRTLRNWTDFATSLLVMLCAVTPWILVVMANASLFTGVWAPVPPNSHVNTAPMSDSAASHEWYEVAGVRRSVPYCIHYDKADQIYEAEVQYLLSRDMLKDDTRHARCVLHPEETSPRVWHVGKDGTKELQSLVTRQPVSNITLPDEGSIEMAPPFLYVLRDGVRYLRLTVRSDDDTHFEPRMVRVDALKRLLANWQHEVAQGALNTQLHYCMCPVFLGILDNMTFFFDTTLNEWEIWLQPHVTYANPLTAVSTPRRMRYSKEIAPLSYYQNQQILDALPDPSGQGHMFRGHDTIRVEFADPMAVRLPDDLNSRERFWMGHGTLARVHEESAPFALTVPLSLDRFSGERLITGVDTVCYMHCQHLLSVVLVQQ